MFASATWHFSTEELPKEESGDLFHVSRRYFRRVQKQKEIVLEPLAAGDVLHPGDEVEVQLSIRSKASAEYVHLRDPRPAGLEPGAVVSGYRWDLGIARYEETRDSGTNFFFEDLPGRRIHLQVPPARQHGRHLPHRPGDPAVDVRPRVHRLFDGDGDPGGGGGAVTLRASGGQPRGPTWPSLPEGTERSQKSSATLDRLYARPLSIA